MEDKTKEMIKEALENAQGSGKEALDNISEIVKNITKEMMEQSKEEGDDLKQTATKVLKDTFNSLGELGKGTIEYLRAAGNGFMLGLKESGTEDNNLIKAASGSITDGLKYLAEAGLYVSKETAKNLSIALENLFTKVKEGKKDE